MRMDDATPASTKPKKHTKKRQTSQSKSSGVVPLAALNVGKRLAANDKSKRDKAVKTLSRWLAKKVDISESEMLKVWKGLFYCMWFSDKPLVQHELATNLAEITHTLSGNNGMLYIKVFFLTMQREWPLLDRYRLDKFYVLMRKFVFHSFKYLQHRRWTSDVVREFVDMLIAGPLHVSDSICPPGIRLHIIDIFIDELCRTTNISLDPPEPAPTEDGAENEDAKGDEEENNEPADDGNQEDPEEAADLARQEALRDALPDGVLATLMEPFKVLLRECNNPTLKERIDAGVCQKLDKVIDWSDAKKQEIPATLPPLEAALVSSRKRKRGKKGKKRKSKFKRSKRIKVR